VVPFSVLDLAPIPEGGDAALALCHTRDLARHAERWGYLRFWLAEHHNMPGIASAATAVVIADVAAATSTIRVGAGGVMLPNHAPIVIAEQYGTLAALHPGRIDLGLGRAPGTDPIAARALRRHLAAGANEFPEDVHELLAYFRRAEPGQRLRAVPGEGEDVPVWILGSSLFGAQLAAALGLPYGFASHFAPAQMTEAVALYRAHFRPSKRLAKPYVMLGYNVFAADTDEEAALLATSMQQAFVNLRRGAPTRLPPPAPGFAERMTPGEQAMLDEVLSCSAVGSRETVQREVAGFLERTGADELIVASMIFDHTARLRSYEITAQIRDALG
jgi:luciferase family oxidoreductase group 1